MDESAPRPEPPLGGWLQRSREIVADFRAQPQVDEVGVVESVGDGIAVVAGLPGVRLGELLRFATGQAGYVLTLEADHLSCVLLDEAADLQAGCAATGTGEVVRVPVGPALLGRVIDPLGRPLDGGAPPQAELLDPAERPAPEIVDRELVHEPVQTGIVVVDALFPLGRGQRELIIGDRASGKTTLAIDAIINQKSTDLICVYVAVGQKSAATARVIEAVKKYGAFERTIVVVAGAASPPGLQWIAPFAGFTVAEYFRDRGQHALIVIDDLSKHAATHRELALLTHQPPGREAYPGDIFYVHARLLERAGRLSAERGGGSLTALPIAETEAGNLSAYIPTNLISITDGQIVLDTRLFHAGQKPAVDTALSVSRVGGKTQVPALRQAVESLRLDYAQFLELEMFARFGASLEPRVQAQLARGQRIRAVFVQPQFAPLPLAEQLALVIALQNGVLDPLPPERMSDFRLALGEWLRRDGQWLAQAAADRNLVIGDRLASLLGALRQLVGSFAPAGALP